ncbi:MAG: hypothetical protein WCY27_03785 [archaeon]|jgi:hypothetical protein|nr:hypothetical protein [archaeon]MDD2478015.1 hypothetical protein [Candidatus ainarchaeum sp.]MDD3084784.1 hypothetical protein [Candidatus ainarchaeum sp.]MDD4221344.1 hypothetical protein [Candidatus ainarchaeum sp.]MDD4662639.1 hypothetical protein [Candidatus ainarchaeum sp.]
MNKKDEKIDLKNLDLIIKKIFSEIMSKKINLDKPLSVNIQFVENENHIDSYEDLENIIVDKDNLYLTLYTPFNLNELRFDVLEEQRKLVIKSYDYQFYKEILLDVFVLKNSLETTFRNNILEIKLKIKNI